MNYILFDPHCENKQNLISMEIAVSALVGRHRCFVFTKGPLYHSTMVVKHNGTVLVEGVDYYTGHSYDRGTHTTARPLVGSIWNVKDSITGTLTIEGNALGGEYVMPQSTIDRYFAERYVAPDVDTWETVMNGDPFFPPIKIKFDFDGWKGEDAIKEALDDVANTIANKDDTTTVEYQIMNDNLNRVTTKVNGSELLTHPARTDNPHRTKHWQVGALQKDASAVNATKVFDKSIEELKEHVQANGINESHLVPLLKRDEPQLITGDVVLHDVITSWGADIATVDLRSGNVRVEAQNDIEINSLYDAGADNVLLRAGSNTLSVRHHAQTDKVELFYNDQRVATTNNLSDIVPPPQIDDVVVNHLDTPTFNLEGNGSQAAPLTGNVIYPPAAYGVPTAVTLTNDPATNEFGKVATPKLVKAIKDAIGTPVPFTARVNDYLLVSNPVLNKNDIGLGGVNNTSDRQKPLNAEANLQLSQLAASHHSHPPHDIIVKQATSTIKGGAMGTVEVPEPTFAVLAAFSPNCEKQFDINALNIRKSIPDYVLNAKKFYFDPRDSNGSSDRPIEMAANQMKIISTGNLYSNGKWYYFPSAKYDLNALIPKPWTNKKAVVMAESAGNLPDNEKTYVIREYAGDLLYDNSDTSVIVAELRLNGDVATIHSYDMDVLRLGDFNEMLEHIHDPNAHGFNTRHFSKNSLHLEHVVDAETVDTMPAKDVTKDDNRYISARAMAKMCKFVPHKFVRGVVRAGTILPFISTLTDLPFIATVVAPHKVDRRFNAFNTIVTYHIDGSNHPYFLAKSLITDQELKGVEISYAIAYPI